MEKLVSDMGRRGFDRMRSPRAATMIALASATGHAHVAGQPNRRGRDDALLDALPDAVGLARLCGLVAPASRCNIARLGGVSRTGLCASRRADGQDGSRQRVFGGVGRVLIVLKMVGRLRIVA
jgi:hypothetical protein